MTADRPDLARAWLGPEAHLLARGVTCTVFKDGVKVLRVAQTAEARLGRQAQIKRHLSGLGQHRRSWQPQGTLPGRQAFTLELQVTGDGQPPSPAGWGALDRVLRTLHALTGPGSGRLLDRSEGLVGSAVTPELGVLSRLPEVWLLSSLACPCEASF